MQQSLLEVLPTPSIIFEKKITKLTKLISSISGKTQRLVTVEVVREIIKCEIRYEYAVHINMPTTIILFKLVVFCLPFQLVIVDYGKFFLRYPVVSFHGHFVPGIKSYLAPKYKFV